MKSVKHIKEFFISNPKASLTIDELCATLYSKGGAMNSVDVVLSVRSLVDKGFLQADSTEIKSHTTLISKK